MRLLLDTQILIWVAIGSPKLSSAARHTIAVAAADISFSVLSVWEVAIKHSLRRGDIPLPPEPFRKALLGAGWTELPITPGHVIGVADLPRIHGDPFDCPLVKQAEMEGLTFLTADRMLGLYGPWVLSV